MSKSQLETVKGIVAEHDFTMIVYYRGHWCPFCRAWLHELQLLSDSIAKRNGGLVVITAEEESKIPEMRKLSGYEGQAISDPNHNVADFLRREKLLDVAISSKAGYPNGMAQPAVLVVRKDMSSLYSWAIVPALMNIGGAKDRPDLHQIVDNVFAKLDGQEPVHAVINLQTFWQGIRTKLFGV